jgi:hypothetical protein
MKRECPACHDLKEHPEHKTIKIVEVNWRPSWEPEEGLRENEDVARMVDTWNEDNKFNPPARMRHTRETPHKHAATGHTPQTPAMGEHIWHTLRDAIKFNTSETTRVLTSALGACCVVVRNVDPHAPHPAAVDVRAAPPTVTTRAACVQQRRHCEGSSQRASKASQNVWTRYGRGHNGRAGPKAPRFHRGPDRQPAASTPHTSRRRAHAPPREPHTRASPKCW